MGDHGADIARTGEIEQKGFDDVVAVMPQGQFVQPFLPGMGKQLGATATGTVETEILPRVLGSGDLRLRGTILGSKDAQLSPQSTYCLRHLASHRTGAACLRLHIHMYSLHLVINGCLPAPLEQNGQEYQRIQATGDRYQHTVAIGEHAIIVHGPAEAPIDITGNAHSRNSSG